MQYKRKLYYNTNQSIEALPATYYFTKADILPAPIEKVNKSTTNSFKDTLSLTEVVTRSKVQIRNISDTISLVEKLVKKTTKVLSNTLSLIEHVVPNKQQFRSFNDHITLSESVLKMKVHIVTLTENINLIEFVREFKNGSLVGIWTKLNKPSITWIKQPKPDP